MHAVYPETHDEQAKTSMCSTCMYHAWLYCTVICMQGITAWRCMNVTFCETHACCLSLQVLAQLVPTVWLLVQLQQRGGLASGIGTDTLKVVIQLFKPTGEAHSTCAVVWWTASCILSYDCRLSSYPYAWGLWPAHPGRP